jgi:hypothetical protein
LYLRADGTWTKDAAQAEAFSGFQNAISAQQHHQLQDCDLVLQMGPEPSAQYDIVLPLSPPKPYTKSKGSNQFSESTDTNEGLQASA